MNDDDEGGTLTSFNCYYGGKFNKVDGEEYYVGGGVRYLQTKAEALFTALMNELPVSLYGQRVWYKLPFEGQDERKTLSNGDPNFIKMCTAAMWIKIIDIFVEPENDGDEIEEDEIEATDEETIEEGRVSRNNTHQRQFDEDERVDRNVASFVDEEFDEYDTPVVSDGEEDCNVVVKDAYLRYKKGSGELKLRQVFDSIEEFKEAVVDYVLKEGWNVKYVRWEKDKSELKCASEGQENCLWKIYCSYEAPLQKLMVKVYNNDHTCIKSGYSKILNQEVIARLFVNDIRDDHNFMPKDIQEQIQKRWDLIASIDKCRKGKRKALEMIQKEHDEQFSRLRDYRLELLDSNEGSTVELETYPGDEGQDIFYRFYICFAALRETWCSYCRPIFGIDGCFLKCTTKGQLLAAVGRDANNQMYPIAWAVVDVENEDNWRWFIQLLQTDLNLGDGDGFSVISDRQKGLLNAVAQLLPKIEHRMCARHIYANLKKNHPHKAEMKGLFWKVAKSYNMAQYNKRLEAVKEYDVNVYESMMMKNPKNCSLAFFKPTTACDDVSNNISESFNYAIDPTRSMPLVEMLETIRRQAMLRIETRKKKAMKHNGRFSLKSVSKIDLEQKKIKYCTAFPAGVGVYEVKEKSSSFKVYMDKHSCTCRRWDMSGLPCRHALKVISYKKLNQEDFISDWYLTSRWRNEYSSPILPVRGSNFWEHSDEGKICPPLRETPQGRKKISRRIKGRHESPQKKKTNDRHESTKRVTRERRIIHCGRCGVIGHNARKCITIGVGEGPSQPPYSQVID